MRSVPSSDVKGLARRAGFLVLAALCATSMLAATASAASVAAKKPKPKGGSSLTKIAKSLKAEEKATFSVTYAFSAAGMKGSWTYAHKPGDFRFAFTSKSVSVIVVQIGKNVYGCDVVASHTFCTKETSSESYIGELDYLDPGAVASKIGALEAGAKNVTSFSQKFAGQESSCVKASYSGEKVTYCVTLKGILAEDVANGVGVVLTGYSAHPPASDFALPKGSTIP